MPAAQGRAKLEGMVKDILEGKSGFLSSATLQADASEVAKRAKDLEKALSHVGTDIRARIGSALLATRVKLDDLMRDWDPSKDGLISKMEVH